MRGFSPPAQWAQMSTMRSSKTGPRPTRAAIGGDAGEPVVIRVAMKPLSTLMRSLDSVDLRSGEPARAVRERSDVCAVPAAAVVGEAMVALVLADAMREKFGGDSLGEMRTNHAAYLERLGRRHGTS